MKKLNSSYIVTITGMLVFMVGLCMIKIFDGSKNIMSTMYYVFIGLGCTIFGYGIGKICTMQAEKADPKMAKRNLINKNDERNVAVRNKAKAKAYDIMVYIFAALQIAFGLMGVGLPVIIILNVAYFSVIGFEIYYFRKLNKEM